MPASTRRVIPGSVEPPRTAEAAASGGVGAVASAVPPPPEAATPADRRASMLSPLCVPADCPLEGSLLVQLQQPDLAAGRRRPLRHPPRGQRRAAAVDTGLQAPAYQRQGSRSGAPAPHHAMAAARLLQGPARAGALMAAVPDQALPGLLRRARGRRRLCCRLPRAVHPAASASRSGASTARCRARATPARTSHPLRVMTAVLTG